MKANNQNSHTGVLWHPNFRVVATLPDTKVIRTSFMVNAAAVALVLATAAYGVTREQELAGTRAQVNEWDTRIRASTPAYTKAVNLQKDFSAAEKRLKEIDGFVTSDFVASTFLRQLAVTLPRFCTIDSAELSGQGVKLRGSIEGPSVKATDIATAYVDQLKADPLFSSQMQSVMLNSITRDQSDTRMSFEIEMKLKGSK
jgi:hypothetical protein